MGYPKPASADRHAGGEGKKRRDEMVDVAKEVQPRNRYAHPVSDIRTSTGWACGA
jgi:hypothetical protein